MLPGLPVSPDCDVAKHVACSGDAWDHDLDATSICGCSCHEGS